MNPSGASDLAQSLLKVFPTGRLGLLLLGIFPAAHLNEKDRGSPFVSDGLERLSSTLRFLL